MKNRNYTLYRRYKNLPRLDIGTQPISSGYQRNADQTQVGYFTQQQTPITQAFVPQAQAKAAQDVAQYTGNALQMYDYAKDIANNTAKTAMASRAKEIASSGFSELKESLLAPMNVIESRITGGDFINGVAPQITSKVTEPVKSAATNAAETMTKKGLEEGAKQGSSKALGTALSAAGIALNAYQGIKGVADTLSNWKDSSTLSAGDINNMAARSTEYTNGVAHDVMGGFDSEGLNRYVEAQNKANKIGGAVSGFGAGAGIGGIAGTIIGGPAAPFAGLIGAGIGGVIGAIGGLLGGRHARKKRERAIEEAKRNYSIAATNYNLQSESEAASQGLRNQYYATHADKGLPISNKRPNAYVGALETLVGTDSNGNVDSAIVLPETSNHKRRRDDYLVHLDEGTGVAGNKIDPYTGLTIAEKVAPLAMMFNSTTNKRDKKVIGDAIKDEMNLQDRLPDNNPSPYETIMADKGKSIRRYLPSFDFGNWDGAEVPLASYLVNEMDDYAMKKRVDRDPIIANMSYAPNPYLMQAGALMPKMVEVSPELRANNDALRHYNYAVDQSSGSAGQKMIQKLAGFGKAIKNQSDIIASKTDRENTMRQQYAQWLSSVGESEAQRKQQALQQYNEMLARGYAQKRQLQDVLAKNRRSNRNDLAQNLYNVIWGNKNINLYYQKLRQDQKNDVEKMGTSQTPRISGTAYQYSGWNPTSFFGTYNPFDYRQFLKYLPS